MDNSDLLIQYLEMLEVPFTDSYIRKRMATRPFGDSMLGLSVLLTECNVSNKCVRLSDDDIKGFDKPFITILNGNFIIARNRGNGEMEVVGSDGKKQLMTIDEFIGGWNYVALIGSVSEKSREPDYNEHKHEEKTKRIIWISAIAGLAILAIAGIWGNQGGGVLRYLLLGVNVCGAYVAFLLLQKDLDIPNPVTHKICGLIKENSCEDVTQSEGAEIFGVLHLSEIGAAFFGANILALLFIPQTWNAICGIALCALPFTLWSIWYQRFKAHAWCALCLCTVGLLWIQGIIVMAGWNGWHIGLGEFLLRGGVTAACYIVMAIAVNAIMRLFDKSMNLPRCEHAYNSLKIQPKVMWAYSAGLPEYDTTPEGCSGMIFGNRNAKYHLTVMSNPYCWPCAMMHRHIKDWPGNDVAIQCVLTSFSPDREDINRFLIAAYQQLGEEEAWDLMCRWFEGGKEKGTAFFDGLGLDITSSVVEEEFNRHKNWVDGKPFPGTPTVLVNRRELTPPYGIDDYMYMNY